MKSIGKVNLIFSYSKEDQTKDLDEFLGNFSKEQVVYMLNTIRIVNGANVGKGIDESLGNLPIKR